MGRRRKVGASSAGSGGGVGRVLVSPVGVVAVPRGSCAGVRKPLMRAIVEADEVEGRGSRGPAVAGSELAGSGKMARNSLWADSGREGRVEVEHIE